MFVSLRNLDIGDVTLVGGKNASLGEMSFKLVPLRSRLVHQWFRA